LLVGRDGNGFFDVLHKLGSRRNLAFDEIAWRLRKNAALGCGIAERGSRRRQRIEISYASLPLVALRKHFSKCSETVFPAGIQIEVLEKRLHGLFGVDRKPIIAYEDAGADQVGAFCRAALAVNSEMILLYWRIGREIVQRQAAHKWGARVIDQLATDLHSEFPDVRGFSPRNLKYMRKLALTWPDQQIVQQIVAQLPWGQNVTLLDKLQDDGQRLWYARAAIEHGWSRDILVHQIETRLHERQGRAIMNFDATMEPVWAAAAADLFKDPYVLDFVDIAEDAHERHLEKALIERIKDLLLELGKGFSFMGSQYRLDVAGQDYYLDLLFYHTRLHSLRGHRS